MCSLHKANNVYCWKTPTSGQVCCVITYFIITGNISLRSTAHLITGGNRSLRLNQDGCWGGIWKENFTWNGLEWFMIQPFSSTEDSCLILLPQRLNYQRQQCPWGLSHDGIPWYPATKRRERKIELLERKEIHTWRTISDPQEI